MTDENQYAEQLAIAREVRDIQQGRNARLSQLAMLGHEDADARHSGRTEWARASVTEDIAAQELRSVVDARMPQSQEFIALRRESVELLRSIDQALARLVVLMEARDR